MTMPSRLLLEPLSHVPMESFVMRSVPRPYNYRTPARQPGETEYVFGEYRKVPERQSSHPASELSPSQQLALLILRDNELTRAVVAKLRHSTVIANNADNENLVERCYARRKADGAYELSPMGLWKAGEVAKKLARELGIDIPTYGQPVRRSGFRRQWFTKDGTW